MVGRAQEADDLDELVEGGGAWEERVEEEHLGDDAAAGPEIDLGAVLGGVEEDFGGAVVARADVGVLAKGVEKGAGAAEVADFEDTGGEVDEEVGGLDVTVDDAVVVDVAEGADKVAGVLAYVAEGELEGVAGVVVDDLAQVQRNELEDEEALHCLGGEGMRGEACTGQRKERRPE